MAEKKESLLYRLIKAAVKLFYPKMKVLGLENLPDEPCIIVGNHTQMNGPICAELYCPGKHYVWCAGEMMKLKEVPGYAFSDFWSQKPKWIQPCSGCFHMSLRRSAYWYSIMPTPWASTTIRAL